MQRLSAADLEGALHFVREAADEAGPDPFPPHVVEALRRLIGCEWASYCALDRPARRVFELVESPLPEDDGSGADFWDIVSRHPLCIAQAHGRFDALKLSDFLTRREFHRHDLYADWFRPAGVEFELEVSLPSPPSHTRTFLFDDGRHDFGERERALLNLLQPHLDQLERAAVARRRAQRLLEAADSASACVLIIDGELEPIGDRAREWLTSYFPGGAGPALLAARGTMTVERGSRSLLIEYVPDDLLILSERRVDAAALTPREQEVITLVAHGLRNSEIAERLWVSPATVRKLLENIYDKLGVHTRTAAVAHDQRSVW
jgi:DNA-binding CsgD family transcriptional regulator